jgi:hypothetical protein
MARIRMKKATTMAAILAQYPMNTPNPSAPGIVNISPTATITAATTLTALTVMWSVFIES